MELSHWILEMCDLHLPVQWKPVQRKAMAVIQPTQPGFKASAGWLRLRCILIWQSTAPMREE